MKQFYKKELTKNRVRTLFCTGSRGLYITSNNNFSFARKDNPSDNPELPPYSQGTAKHFNYHRTLDDFKLIKM